MNVLEGAVDGGGLVLVGAVEGGDAEHVAGGAHERGVKEDAEKDKLDEEEADKRKGEKALDGCVLEEQEHGDENGGARGAFGVGDVGTKEHSVGLAADAGEPEATEIPLLRFPLH